MHTEEAVRILQKNESENRQRMETMEASIGDKANKTDIQTAVNEQVRKLISNPLQIFRRSQ